MSWLLLFLVLGAGWWYYSKYKKMTSTSFLLEQLEPLYQNELRSLERSHLQQYLDTEKHILNVMHDNAVRLFERYRHDDKKLRDAMNDWAHYMQGMHEVVFNREMHDVESIDTGIDRFENIRQIRLKAVEVEKRFAAQLGSDYVDPHENGPRKKSMEEILGETNSV